MKQARDSKRFLVALAGVLLILVLTDRLGWLPGAHSGGSADEAPVDDARSRYLSRADDARRDRSLLADAEKWRTARDEAGAAWNRWKTRLVPGATPELAETRFRERVLSAMGDITLLSPVRINYLRDAPPSAPAPGGPSAATPTEVSVRRLSLRVEFDVASPRDAYAILDRLENMPDAQASISHVSLAGPGRIQQPEIITVGLTLSALAITGGEDGEES